MVMMKMGVCDNMCATMTIQKRLRDIVEGQLSPDVVRINDAAHIALIVDTLAFISILIAERDEAERRVAEEIGARADRSAWLSKAKRQWGVDDNVSFDDIWAEALALKARGAGGHK